MLDEIFARENRAQSWQSRSTLRRRYNNFCLLAIGEFRPSLGGDPVYADPIYTDPVPIGPANKVFFDNARETFDGYYSR